MAAPKYFKENRYSYLVADWQNASTMDYQSSSPVSTFERRVQRMFLDAQQHLHHEEFRLALDTFRELQALILKTADPRMPVDPRRIPRFKFPKNTALIDVFARRSAEILRNTPITEYVFPKEVIPDGSRLPAPVQKLLTPAIETEMHVTSFHKEVSDSIRSALEAAEDDNWGGALRHYTRALAKVPQADKAVRASLLHDMSIINEKANRRAQAEQLGQQSVTLFGQVNQPKAQVHALDTLTGIFTRSGKTELAKRASSQALTLRKKHNLHRVVLNKPIRLEPIRTVRSVDIRFRSVGGTPLILTPESSPSHPLVHAAVVGSTPDAPALMGFTYMPKQAEVRKMTFRSASSTASIVLDPQGANVAQFLKNRLQMDDLDILTAYWQTPKQIVAYLPHMYFFVIPMAIGDCLEGMGNLVEAENEYLSVLSYPFINQKVEIVRWWTRLAELYLEMGDEAYRRAKDSPAGWNASMQHYKKIVLPNGTVPANSPLYKNPKLATIKERVTAFLADSATVTDNPRVLTKVLRAQVKLAQIKAGLNFFGFGPDYFPPFSFEYLQNTARYFAQNAAQIEQQYIQYKSTAENEEFRREQLDQQADVARQTVVLEQRGLAEAIAGIGVATASLNYAEVQRQNAVKAKQDFQNVRWELLELAEAEAWANASSVDRDDQVKLTWNGHYYSSRRKRRNVVLQDLAYQRTRLSHDLEANKLQREIDSAIAYKGVAQAQVNQAQARRNVALQRVRIAELQQRHAEENRDFLDMKEFSARLWYELARESRRMSKRYLDMAIETAMLMERAYNAETERGLRIVRFDYGLGRTNDLLAGNRLLLDIDTFTHDHITTIKPKKTPVKKTFSLADRRPMAFQQLKSTGQCFFQTELEDFDREHPGLYLCKLRGVELLFVGITESATSVAGTLRNVGVSRFRAENGAVTTRHYPSDVTALSQYDVTQDALAFRFSPNDLRLFENNGIDTLWQLDLPLDANDFNFNEILDVQLVMYYDGFFSPTLEATVKAALPQSATASRAFSMRMLFPDELFYLKSKAEAELEFDAGMFPHNQTNLKRTDVILKATGDSAVIDGLTMRLRSEERDMELVLKTNSDGEVNDATPGKPLRKLRNRTMLDKWTLKIRKEDNPGLVVNDKLDITGLQDVMVFFEYSFDYR